MKEWQHGLQSKGGDRAIALLQKMQPIKMNTYITEYIIFQYITFDEIYISLEFKLFTYENIQQWFFALNDHQQFLGTWCSVTYK